MNRGGAGFWIGAVVALALAALAAASERIKKTATLIQYFIGRTALAA